VEKADFMIRKLQGQIDEMDEKVAGLICDLKELNDKKKENCLKTANEMEKKISEMQQQVENLKKRMTAPDFNPISMKNLVR
jgi:hypothetical protein